MKTTRPFTESLFLAALCAPLLGGVGAAAQTEPATAVVTATATAHKGSPLEAAQNLRANFVITTTYPGTTYHDLQERGVVTLARPNKVRIEISRFRRVSDRDPWESAGNGSVVVSDNETVGTLIQHPHSSQFRKEAADPTTPIKLLANLPTLQAFFATSNGKVNEATKEPGRKNNAGSSRQVQITKTETDVSVSPNTFVFAVPPDASPLAPQAPARRTAFADAPRGGGLLAIGDAAPDFVLRDANGKPVRLSDYKGKVVLLKFWATWCWPCRQSLPETQKLARAYPADAVVLMVDIWDSKKGFTAWEGANKKTLASNVRLVFDPAAQADARGTAQQFHVSTTPTQYVIGRDGRIAGAFTGYDGPSPALEAAVRDAISVAAPATQTASTGFKKE